MRYETTPTVEPLLPEGTPVNVYDEDGRKVLSGFYAHACISRPCFAEDERPENYAHTVFNSRMTDWGLADTWHLTKVTPPHTIEPDEEAIALALHDGSAWQRVRECRLLETKIDHRNIEYYYGTTVWRLCSECAEEVLASPANFCPNCGAKAVGA